MSFSTGLNSITITHILKRLRPEDKEEIEAVRGPFNPTEMAREICGKCYGKIFWDFHKGAIAAVGFHRMTPTCAGVWAFATSDWPLVYRSVTKHVRRIMVPQLLEAGFHRAECRALSKRDDTRRWLVALGADAEAVLSGFGVRREDFTLFAWTTDEQNHLRQSGRKRHPSLRDGV